MKKSTTLYVIPLFFLFAIFFASCVKDEYRETKPGTQPVLKSGSDFGLPIYMSKNTLIGEAEIYIENETIVVNVLLNEGYMPSEAHLYAGENAPPKPAPGLFPYHWNTGDGYPISFVIDISDWWDGESFDWYFALHLKIGNESAWLLPEVGGTDWLNNGGKPIGWGQYFFFGFEIAVDFNLTYMSLVASEADCSEDFGCVRVINASVDVINDYPTFTFCLTDMYIDLASFETTKPLMEYYLNAFKLNPEDPDEVPFFYIVREMTNYKLVDGANTSEDFLILNFSPGTYSYTGTLLSEDTDSVEVTITFKFEYCE